MKVYLSVVASIVTFLTLAALWAFALDVYFTSGPQNAIGWVATAASASGLVAFAALLAASESE